MGIGTQQLGVGLNAAVLPPLPPPAVLVTGVSASGTAVTWTFSANALTVGAFGDYVYGSSAGTSAVVSAGAIVVNYPFALAIGLSWAVNSQPGSTFVGGGQLTVPQSGTSSGAALDSGGSLSSDASGGPS